MARFIKKPPSRELQSFGNLGFVGTRRLEHARIEVISYSETHFDRQSGVAVESLAELKGSLHPVWINVCGLHDLDLIRQIAEVFNLHPAVIDKITNSGARASFEDFDDYLVVTMKLLKLNEVEYEVEAEHILFVLYGQVLITFQENDQDPFEPIRMRMGQEVNRVRSGWTDYLMFALLRALLHDYRYLIERIGEHIENLEDVIFERPSEDVLVKLSDYKLEINYILRYIRPAKDAILQLLHTDSALIHPKASSRVMNNVMELILLATDASENYRQILNDELNIYHTNMASRLNEMFRILTVFSVIFVPLTFLAGIYGMNFEHIPELSYPYAYFILLGIMLLVALGMLVYFRRKEWL